MRGVVFLGNRTLELREFPDPTPGPGEVVLATSIPTAPPATSRNRSASAARAAPSSAATSPAASSPRAAPASPRPTRRRIPLTRLLAHRFKLEQADEAYRLFDTQTTGKGVFVF